MTTQIETAPVAGIRSPWLPGRTGLRYGGDYNPEQWPREVWLEDIALMKQAGINLVSVGIFSWALLEPREGEYDFGFLDDIIGLLADAGIDVDLATPTAVPPAWFWKAYPQAHPVTRDGVTLGNGSRGIVSPSSPEYRRAARAITLKLAERYAMHPSVVLWHVHNEYGTPISDDYSDNSVTAFREWLVARYGTLDALNEAWGTRFWGQTYGEWNEIDAPRRSATVVNQTQRLDFARFTSDALLACYTNERDAIKEVNPDALVTTNFMVTNCRSIDYWKWAGEVDIVANDYYLVAERSDNHVLLAMDSDLTRSLAGGAPWILMEHSTSAVNWQSRNIAKRPGELARNSCSHLARGADAIMFFQFRASRYGAEKFHSAMLPHAGVNTRIWREVEALGAQLGSLADVQNSRVEARVAIIWDVESFWAQDLEWRPSIELDHRERVEAFYSALFRAGVTVDFVHPHGDLGAYDLVFAPSLYLADAQTSRAVTAYVEAGGTFVASYFSGVVDQNDAVWEGGAPGAFRTVLGLSIPEFLPLHEGELVELDNRMTGAAWSDDIELEGASIHASFSSGPAAGKPAITRNEHGSGSAWYLSTRIDGSALDAFVATTLADAGVTPDIAPAGGLEIVTRHGADADFTFLINHSDADVEQQLPAARAPGGTSDPLTVTVPAGEVRVIRRP